MSTGVRSSSMAHFHNFVEEPCFGSEANKKRMYLVIDEAVTKLHAQGPETRINRSVNRQRNLGSWSKNQLRKWRLKRSGGWINGWTMRCELRAQATCTAPEFRPGSFAQRPNHDSQIIIIMPRSPLQATGMDERDWLCSKLLVALVHWLRRSIGLHFKLLWRADGRSGTS